MPKTKGAKKVMAKMKDKYGDKKGEQIYYATANKQGRDEKSFKKESFEAHLDNLLAIFLEDDWPEKLDKGSFTRYCKNMGFSGPSASCAKKAMKSKSPKIRGKASFYMNTVKPKGKDASDVA